VRIKPRDRELDEGQKRGNTTCTPQTYIGGVDPAPKFPLLATTETGGDCLDRGPPSCVPPVDRATPVSCRLHGLTETCALERIPSTNQGLHGRKVLWTCCTRLD